MFVTPIRPRIWLTPAILADLKSRAIPAVSDRWNTLLDLANRPGASWDDCGIQGYSLVYLITGDKQYSDKAWTLMSQSMAAGLKQVTPDSGYQCRNYFPAACCLYDWGYPALTTAQRQQLAADIDACAAWVYPRSNPSRVGAWAIDSVGNNYHAGFQFTWLAGLALMGDHPNAQGYLDEALRRWNENVLPYCNTTAKGGVLFEGTSYSTDWLGMTLMQLLAHSTATDQDLLTPQLSTGWCGDAITAMIHLTTPDRQRLVPTGDQTKSSSGALQDAARLPMLIAASRGSVPARIWLDSVVPSRNQSRSNAWIEYLFYPGTPAAPTGGKG